MNDGHSLAVTDRFRQAHQLDYLCYQVSEGVAPISIRDQIIRATMLVDHILATGEVSCADESMSVLVVGGGPAGIAMCLRAAQWAARLPMTVTLLEEEEYCLRLLNNTTRQIHPTIYEWPAPSCTVNKFPAGDRDPSRLSEILRWAADNGSVLAEYFTNQLKECVSTAACAVELRCPATVVGEPTVVQTSSSPSGPDRVAVTIKDDGGTRSEQFHLVLFATGMGEEKTWVPQPGKPEYTGGYWGPRFWENDQANEKNLGLDGTQPKVLISGAGDGALQDFIRILTGQEASTLLTQMENAFDMSHMIQRTAGVLGDSEDLSALKTTVSDCMADLHAAYEWQAAKNALWEAENLYRILRHWHGDTRRLDDDTRRIHLYAVDTSDRDLQATHDDVVRRLFTQPSTRKILEPLLQSWFKDRPLPQPICLVYRETTFTRCYGLNRFLASLINHYLCEEMKFFDRLWFPGCAVREVKCIRHDPPDYNTYRKRAIPGIHPCWGKPHHVEYSGVDGKYALPSEFNIVLLRHGIHLPEAEDRSHRVALAAPFQLLPHRPDPSYWQAWERAEEDKRAVR